MLEALQLSDTVLSLSWIQTVVLELLFYGFSFFLSLFLSHIHTHSEIVIVNMSFT